MLTTIQKFDCFRDERLHSLFPCTCEKHTRITPSDLVYLLTVYVHTSMHVPFALAYTASRNFPAVGNDASVGVGGQRSRVQPEPRPFLREVARDIPSGGHREGHDPPPAQAQR